MRGKDGKGVSLLLNSVIKLAKEAGEKIKEIYQQIDSVAVHIKSDQSPLTEADLIAHQVLAHGLKQLTPHLPILSEESVAIPFAERSSWQRYWLVDPLDGTKEFIQKTDDFTVNIALIEDHKPILGVIYAPISGLCYFAEKGQGAFKQLGENLPQPIHSHSNLSSPVTVVVSRRHGLAELQAFLQRLGDHTIVNRGSALKFCLVADGTADIYPRFGPTSEWDTAAGQCIVEVAGGKVVDLSGGSLDYNTKESLLNPSFLVIGDARRNFDTTGC